MTLHGKGFFIKDLTECESGQPASILAAARAAGLEHVLIKIAEGVRACGINPSGGDIAAPVVQALQSAGIAVWGWHPIQGRSPSAEAAIAIDRTRSLGLDGYVLEAREEYQQPGMAAHARQFMEALHASLKVPLALSSYRFPNHHPNFPWADFLQLCDLHMPQIYWEQAHNSVFQLIESMHQCDALPNARPYFPTGVTYATPGWDPSSEEVLAFLQAAKALGLPGVNFFSWEGCRALLPELWTTISGFTWPAPVSAPAPSSPTPSPDLFLEEFLAALNSRSPARVALFYDPAASQVWADQILTGVFSIQAGFIEFFASLPAGTKFSLLQVHIEDDSRHFAWRAGPLNGETTFILKNDRIVLDYTFLA